MLNRGEDSEDSEDSKQLWKLNWRLCPKNRDAEVTQKETYSLQILVCFEGEQKPVLISAHHM